MTSINDLLGKKKKQDVQTLVKPTPNALRPDLVIYDDKLLHIEPKQPSPLAKVATGSITEKEVEKKGFSLNLGVKKNENKSKETSSQNNSINSDDDNSFNIGGDAFASLGAELDNISFDIDDTDSDKISPPNLNAQNQFQNPTLTDVEKFVFEEQPDHSTQEITNIFSSMIDDLSLSTGDQVPKNVARCLKFIKEHDFLADILKPEAIGVLVNGLRRSYGFIVKAKTVKGEKKKARDAKVSDVLDSLSDLSF